ncbi:putative esterase of the alpha-beta hydrolase superfamily, partial [Protomyces lactucae-debilis]
LKNAKSYEEYEKAALALDYLEGRYLWKADAVSPHYDSELVQVRLDELRLARSSNNFERVLFLLRTTLSRQLGDMGNPKLYAYTHTGTKFLIEEYIEEVRGCFYYLMEQVKLRPDIDTRSVLNALLKTRQSFGRTALLLSGGGTLGMMHIGVVTCLWESRLLPRIISGSSAGAIVAAIVCTHTDAEIPGLLTKFPFGALDVFQDGKTPETPLLRLGRFLKHGVFMDIGYLRGVMAEWMGDMTFGEAFNKTRRILNITVSSSSVYEMPRLLNHITAPNVIIWSAVAASCSVPLVFAGSPLLAKDFLTGEPVVWDEGSNKCIDGSIEGDLPTTRLSELFNVDHFIVSQVNPHVTIFLPKATHDLQSAHWLPRMVVDEVLHYTDVLMALGVAPSFAQRLAGILKQRYIGDITILPQKPLLAGLYRLLTNPDPEFMLDASARGQYATWEQLPIIRNHLQIEMTIDNTLHALRLALV